MSGLGHYRNSTPSMKNWEPVYLNHFNVVLTPPAAVGNWEFVIENVTNIGGLEVDKQPAVVEQKFKGHTRTYAGSKPEQTYVDITLSFEVNLDDSNSMYVFKALREWCDLIYDPLTGEMGLKSEYAGGPMQITLFNKRGGIFRKYKFPVVFPVTALPAIELDHDSADIYKIENFTLRADYWDDTIA
jgi:hypothetical protein